MKLLTDQDLNLEHFTTEGGKLNVKFPDANNTNTANTTNVKLPDTGWVEVKSDEIRAGAVYFRRIGNVCYCALGGGNFDTISLKNRATHYSGNRRICGIPKGFRLQKPTMSMLTEDGQKMIGIVVLTSETDANIVAIRGVAADANVGLCRAPIISYPTEDPFPT